MFKDGYSEFRNEFKHLSDKIDDFFQFINLCVNNRTTAVTKKHLQSLPPMIYSLAKAVDLKDNYTNNHSQKIADFSVAIADRFNFSKEEKADLYAAALLHDVGKIGIPDSILLKPDKLTPDEYEEMKKHPMLGARILEPLKDMVQVRNLILHHHEKVDGTGYPFGLKGEEIPLGSRILALIDAFNAMTTDRVYRRAFSLAKAKREIEKFSGTQFDPKVVDVFNENYHDFVAKN